MGQFDSVRMPLTSDAWDKFQQMNAQAHNTDDFDSGWIATPSLKQFRHNLGMLPRAVHVYASDDSHGNNYVTDTATAVNSSTITITGPKAFCRVLANK